MGTTASYQSCVLQSPSGIDATSKIARILTPPLTGDDISLAQAKRLTWCLHRRFERFTPLKGGRVNDPITLFRDALQGIFGPFDWLPDCATHHLSEPDDKPETPNGWYALPPGGVASSSRESLYSQPRHCPEKNKLKHPEACHLIGRAAL